MKNLSYQPKKFLNIEQFDNGKLDKAPLTKKIAVFFTDIVGSTEFFKLYGDEQGREMLQHHYNTASYVITRFNGHIIKYIGDSIMAYFEVPINALKAAISLQQKVQAHNKQTSALSVRIRVGIHYGNVLIEEEDIYGDVVNIASKLTNLAGGDEIYISNEMYNQIKDMPFVHFKLVDHTDKKKDIDMLTIFSVSWDEDLILDNENIVFFISPIVLLNSTFSEFWKKFIKVDDQYLRDKIKRASSKNNTLKFYVADPLWTFDIAKYLMDSLVKVVKNTNELGVVPVYFVIDNIMDLKNDIYLFEEYKKSITPGSIYLSEEAFIATGNVDFELIKKPPINAGSKRFYKLLYPSEKNREVEPFFYGYILTEGPYKPCFYCGSKKHKTAHCPSKNLPDITDAIEKLANYSIDKINNLFFNLSQSPEFSESGSISNEDNIDQKISYEALFEPERVYQLRFLRTIWNCSESDWIAAKNTSCGNEGGLVWLAQDSLRISDYKNVEACLNKAMENSSENFRIYCIHALLCIEKEDMENSEKYLKKAIKHAKNRIHKDFLSLLLARLYFFENRLYEASQIINDILHQDPFCLDASYLGMKIDLKIEKYTKAMGTLMDLIQDYKDYFLIAYIDCELFPYREIIADTLEKIFKNAKQNALEVFRDVEKEFLDSKDFIDNQAVSELEGLFLKIKNLMHQDSFFGYLNVAQISQTIKSKIHNFLREKKKKVIVKLEEISSRINKTMKLIDDLKYKRLAFDYKVRLEKFSKDMEGIFKKMEGFSLKELEEVAFICEKIDNETKVIEEKLDNVVFLNRLIISLRTFTKYMFLSMAFMFLMSFFVLPFIEYHLNNIFPRLGFNTPINTVSYNRELFLWGGVVGFIISALASIRKFLK